MDDTQAPTPPPTSGIERALDVLGLFLADGVRDLGVTEIADQLGLSKAVVHRALRSFTAAEVVELDEDTRRYRLGVRTLHLGMAYLRGNDALEMAGARLRELSDATHETATLSVRSRWRRTYVAQATPARDIKMEVRVGASYPLHAGASSKSLLAFMPEEFRAAYLAQGDLETLTGDTVVNPAALRRELDSIRESGFARSEGERQPGAGAVAAPVLDATGTPVAALSICGPRERLRDQVEHHAEHLLAVTRDLSARLGHRSPT